MRRTLLLVMVLTANCGGSDDDDPKAKEKCDMVVSTVCARFAQCTATSDPQSFVTQNSQCRGEAAVTFDCNKATGVSPSYQTCLDQVAAHPCNLVAAGELPASCLHVVKHP
jgi:hypothetical protein